MRLLTLGCHLPRAWMFVCNYFRRNKNWEWTSCNTFCIGNKFPKIKEDGIIFSMKSTRYSWRKKDFKVLYIFPATVTKIERNIYRFFCAQSRLFLPSVLNIIRLYRYITIRDISHKLIFKTEKTQVQVSVVRNKNSLLINTIIFFISAYFIRRLDYFRDLLQGLNLGSDTLYRAELFRDSLL